jgi:hypothetical protein
MLHGPWRVDSRDEQIALGDRVHDGVHADLRLLRLRGESTFPGVTLVTLLTSFGIRGTGDATRVAEACQSPPPPRI